MKTLRKLIKALHTFTFFYIVEINKCTLIIQKFAASEINLEKFEQYSTTVYLNIVMCIVEMIMILNLSLLLFQIYDFLNFLYMLENNMFLYLCDSIKI